MTVDATELNSGVPLTGNFNLDMLAAVPAGPALKRIDALNVFGQLRFFAHYSHGGTSVLDPATPDGLATVVSAADIGRRLEVATGIEVTAAELISDYDNYYYDRDHQRPLPVVRGIFDDPEGTWVYIDPATGGIVGQNHRLTRLDRWLFNGLHSLDFSFWYDKRPLWDIVIIVLSIGGLATSGIGLWLGASRVRRWAARRQP